VPEKRIEMTSVLDTIDPRTVANDKPIPSRLLRKSLDKILDILGICLSDYIFEDMYRSGIVFGPDKSYSMNKLHEYFGRTLGIPTADLLVKQLHVELQGV